MQKCAIVHCTTANAKTSRKTTTIFDGAKAMTLRFNDMHILNGKLPSNFVQSQPKS